MQIETEIAIYAAIGDFHGLLKANSKETHIQASHDLSDDVSIRVRKTIIGHDSHFEETIKTKKPSETTALSRIETTVSVTKDFFNAFLLTADFFMHKDRYIFICQNQPLTLDLASSRVTIVIPKIIYECDVFIKDGGGYHSWCKIDIELDDILTYINLHHSELDIRRILFKVNHLPFMPTKPFIKATATNEQKKLLDTFYENFFLKKTQDYKTEE